MSDYPEGWYDDPQDQGRERYWNGQGWTEDVRAKFPPGWYDDPKRFGAERYWDGVGWTNEQRFLTRLDQLFPAPLLRKKDYRLIVAGDHLSWGEASIRWDDVTGFDTLTRLYNGRPSLYSVFVTANGNKTAIELAPSRKGPNAADAFATIVDQAQRVITPRVLNDLFPQADAGATVEYEKVALSPQGFAKRGKDPVPWSEYGGWRTGNGMLEINRMKGDKAKVAVRSTTTQLGRWVLVALIEDYASRYSKPA